MGNQDKPTVCTFCGMARLEEFKLNLSSYLANIIKARPDQTYKEIGKAFGVSERTIQRYAKRAGIERTVGVKQVSHTKV
jgi:hypothetical protein